MIFYVSLQPPAPIEIKGNFNLPNSLWYAYKIKAAISFVVYDNIIKSFININIFLYKTKMNTAGNNLVDSATANY